MIAPTRTAGAPLLSVLCLTYNHAEFITRALASFLAQDTSFDFEIVVSDDCSSDQTREIVGRHADRPGARIRLLQTPVNLGVTRNFRRAMNACSGQYIALCEGDDFWRGHNKLQLQVDFLEAHPEFVMTYHDATLVDEHGEHTTSQLPRHLQCDTTSAELIATRPISTLTVCFRNLLKELPAELDHAPALDLCLWSLLGQHGRGKFMADIEPAGYRVHAGGVFSTQTDRNRHVMTAQALLCLSRVYARRGDARASDTVLLRAALMAAQPLRFMPAARLLLTVLARMLVRPLRMLRASGRTGPKL